MKPSAHIYAESILREMFHEVVRAINNLLLTCCILVDQCCILVVYWLINVDKMISNVLREVIPFLLVISNFY